MNGPSDTSGMKYADESDDRHAHCGTQGITMSLRSGSNVPCRHIINQGAYIGIYVRGLHGNELLLWQEAGREDKTLGV